MGAWARLGALSVAGPTGTPRVGLPGWPGPDCHPEPCSKGSRAAGPWGGSGERSCRGRFLQGGLLPTTLLAPHHPKDIPSRPGQEGTQP